MPVGSRKRAAVLDAAVRVLGTGGPRALTHRAVDRAAGVAEGTTSNYFRARKALIAGILAYISEQEGPPAALLSLTPSSEDSFDAETLVVLVAERIRFLLGEGRTLTLARHALFLEAAAEPDLRPGLLAESQRWWQLGAALLDRLGVPNPDHRSRLLFAYIDGLLLDQLARPSPDFDAATAVRAGLQGLLAR